MTGTDATGSDSTVTEIRVWDWPVRVIHAGFIVLLPALWWTAEEGQFTWHMILGAGMLGLLAFRIAWGFVGSSTARFASFVRGLRTIVAYVQARRQDGAPAVIGHNPLGGWSVLALLALLLGQTSLGLVAGDPDDSAAGPLNHLVSYTTANQATELHELVFNGIVGLVVLHIVAVLGYLVLKADNLILPMITGHRAFPAPAAQPAVAPTHRVLVCAALSAGLAYWLHAGAPLP